MALRTISRNSASAASPRRLCSSASISCTGPKRVMRLGDAVTMRGTEIAAACAADLRGVATALSMTGPVCFGGFALTIRCGMGGDSFFACVLASGGSLC